MTKAKARARAKAKAAEKAKKRAENNSGADPKNPHAKFDPSKGSITGMRATSSTQRFSGARRGAARSR